MVTLKPSVSLSSLSPVGYLVIISGIALLFCSQGLCADSGSDRYIDLTHEFSSETLYWPTSKKFELEKVFEGKTERGLYYAANNFCAAEHGGIHLDAPIHFAEDAQTAEQVPLENLIGEAIVVDVTEKTEKDRDYEVAVRDFVEWESEHGEIPSGAIVLLRTGYSVYWPDAVRYLGTARRGKKAIRQLHFPGLHPEAAQWLVDRRKIKAVGIDTASIDRGQAKIFMSHRILLGRNIPVFENLVSLEKLPAKGARLIALPMKIKGGSGAPLRAVAVLQGESS